MKAYLIDPVERRITEVTLDNDIDEISALIHEESFDACAINNDGDSVYVGEFSEQGDQSRFSIEGCPNRFFGKGLVVGVDSEGRSRSPAVQLAMLRPTVSFYPSIDSLRQRSRPPIPK